jgi:CBS domain-containing protein
MDHHLSILDDAFKVMFPDFKREDELTFVSGDSPASMLLDTLRHKKVPCVTVLDEVKKVDDSPRVQGLVDITDIAAFLLDLKKGHVSKCEKLTFEGLLSKKLEDVKTKEIINYSGLNQAAILGVQTRLMDVFAALTIPGVHRVPVMSLADERKISRSSQGEPSMVGKFVTQGQVLRFMATHIEAFGKVLERTIVAARVGEFKPKFVNLNATAFQGFQTMIKEKVSGIAVIDDNYKVVGSLSTTDLRLVVLTKPSINLNVPISEFLEEVRKDPSYQKPPRAVTCSYTDTVHTVITKLNSNQVRRLFVVDDHELLIGVVSLSGVLKYILRSGSAY